MLFVHFNTVVAPDRAPLEAAHRAFLAIDEYWRRISPDIMGDAEEEPDWVSAVERAEKHR